MSLPEDPGFPWDRRDDETSQAYAAFQYRLELGPNGTLRQVAEKLHQDRGRGSVETRMDTVKGWSAKHEWTHRAAAWWDEQHRLARAASSQTVVEMAKRHAEIAQSHLAVALEPARSVLEAIVAARGRGEDPFKGMTIQEKVKLANDAARVVGQLAEVERLSRGIVFEQQGDSAPRIEADMPDWTGDPERAAQILEAWADAGIIDLGE